MKRTLRRFTVPLGTTVALVGAVAAPAAAASTGTVAFYSTTSYSGLSRSISYTDCDTARTFSLGQTGSYNNTPITGCKVEVSVSGSTWYTLCQGKHVLPAAFRDGPTARVIAGTTPLTCV